MTATMTQTLYTVWGPRYPGSEPATLVVHSTLDRARLWAERFGTDRPDLRSIDVRIYRHPDSVYGERLGLAEFVEYAGP